MFDATPHVNHARRSWIADAAWGSTIAVLVAVLFHFFGSADAPESIGRSVFRWIQLQWMARGGDFAHAWLMPIISLMFVWKRRDQLAAAPKRASWFGVGGVAVLLIMHWLMVRAEQPRISLLAFAGLTWFVPYAVWGGRVSRWLTFPCLYLALCFGSYFLVPLTFKLRLGTSMVSAAVLNGVGIATARAGTALYSEAGGGFSLDVADPCSGLRSLVVVTALCAPYAVVTQPTLWGKWVLFGLSVPLAAAANICRILSLAGVAALWNQEVALHLYHDFAGFLVFGIAIVLITITGRGLLRFQRSEEVS